MYFGSLLFFKFAILFMFGKSRGQSDCSGCCGEGNYTVIVEPRRSINSIWEVGQVALCDRALAWGWYRFKSFVGGQMPTSIVSPNRCGTVAPVWIQGKHPSEEVGTVTRKACVNFFNISKGCADSFNIQVRNCTTFYVYFLRPTYSCAIAYCAGKRKLLKFSNYSVYFITIKCLKLDRLFASRTFTSSHLRRLCKCVRSLMPCSVFTALKMIVFDNLLFVR